jgi:hypothetical protein
VCKFEINPSRWLKREYMEKNWIFQRVELQKSCAEQKVIFCQVMKSEEIWTVEYREDTW